MCQENRRKLQISGEIRKSVFHCVRIIVFVPERWVHAGYGSDAQISRRDVSAHEGTEFFQKKKAAV